MIASAKMLIAGVLDNLKSGNLRYCATNLIYPASFLAWECASERGFDHTVGRGYPKLGFIGV